MAQFSRKSLQRDPAARILIVTEDTKSSSRYLGDFARYLRVRVNILHAGKTDPLGIVQFAAQMLSGYDMAFCVIDRDEHPSFQNACNEAAKHAKISLIDSHPCFEYWYVLHFGYTTKPYARQGNHSPADALISDLRKFPGMTEYQKGAQESPFEGLLDKYETAKQNAQRSLESAMQCGNPNPSTKVHQLLQQLHDIQ